MTKEYLYAKIPVLTDAQWLELHKEDAETGKLIKEWTGRFSTYHTYVAYQGIVYRFENDKGKPVVESAFKASEYGDGIAPNEVVCNIVPGEAPDDFVLKAIAAAAGHRLA